MKAKNSHLTPKVNSKKAALNIDELFDKLISGEMASLSKAITLLESTNKNDNSIATLLVNKCQTYLTDQKRNTKRIAITGIPGVGKSTFIDKLGISIIEQGCKVAVLAIDPSSEKLKGSILGDKTRMEKLSLHPDAFVRPSPTSGSLGGVARKTRDSILLCEAAGFDFILIETVGVGQSETLAYQMVDLFMLLMIAGTGDELQGIKRGIMELADVIILNKTDQTEVKLLNKTKSVLIQALNYQSPNRINWKCKICEVSSLESKGIENVYQTLSDFFSKMEKSKQIESNRLNQNINWLELELKEAMWKHFSESTEVKELIYKNKKLLTEGKISVSNAVETIIEKLS